ncbi:unnamed protein product [Mycena citricolor]|uniref:Uncharacterized protein n=1 Tax=Mycena citricolor TaxID=2018698 RepID=A0AAD2HHW5_9AGAR|nr:unnamed protein product [Mycena citricolor]CAK5276959.1 unnamed protein product [Mycena citricolor]
MYMLIDSAKDGLIIFYIEIRRQVLFSRPAHHREAQTHHGLSGFFAEVY